MNDNKLRYWILKSLRKFYKKMKTWCCYLLVCVLFLCTGKIYSLKVLIIYLINNSLKHLIYYIATHAYLYHRMYITVHFNKNIIWLLTFCYMFLKVNFC